MIREIVGVDVASKELVAYREDGAWVTVPNQKRDIGALLKDLPKGAIVALEATGGYGHLLAELACKKGFTVYPNESGKFKGKRRISHQGDPHLRRAVYMAGLAGTVSKVWKPYYQELIKQKKLAPIAAINALGRKILHTVFGVFRSQTEFELLTLDIKT